jgi:site-specific DNA recombinase
MFGFAAKTLDVIEDEAELVREAAGRVLAGEPMNRVVEDWHGRGIRPIRGERWKVVSLRRLLLNPRVAQLVGDDQALALVRMFNQPGRQSLGRPAEHLLSGILVCSRCQTPLYGAQKGGKDQPAQLVYRCKKASGSGGRFAGCGSTVVSMARADAWAEEMFVAAIVSDAWAESLSRRQAELLEDDTAEDLDSWREELADLEQVQGTRFYSEAMKRRHDELRRMVDQATSRLMARPDLQALIDLPRSEEELRARWQRWSTADRRVWIRRLVDHIDVKPATSRSRASAVEERLDPVWKM